MFISDDLQQRWWALEAKLVERFGKKPDLEAVLFLIGMQETGFLQEKISKEQKQDLMHIATCRLLSIYGFYDLKGLDEQGWPHWENKDKLPVLSLKEQDLLLKQAVLDYFKEVNW